MNDKRGISVPPQIYGFFRIFASTLKKIDHETVQRILDTAQIVDVVSDFVTLKRRGSGYIGLCPFHNERTPSFSVSPSKGICKCFSCGKGGSPVNFIMELEQLTFAEALRYLANKYNIEIKEDEMSEEEMQAENDRASMFAINDFAAKHFATNLTEHPDGRAIGLSYFRERGINDLMVKKFHLGYALDRNDILDSALRAGYTQRFLLETGLCIRRDNGEIYDRFKGRVIYPVHTISGKVVAFGGRTLRSDKNVAKYVNSPESSIYHKQRELYGLYQAKQAIAKQDKCILVEGYMDVISMHQAGVENVVASSGTSLTDAQVRLIHRFTENVTLIYDADSAGIKASLRGIDMLLAEGLAVKLLLLPPGEDPDSFARSHTSQEVEEYIAANETDFITFKTQALMKGSADDPVGRAKVINAVVESISKIPDPVTRGEYVRSTSRTLGVDDSVLNRQVAKFIARRLDEEAKERLRAKNRREAGLDDPASDLNAPPAETPAEDTPSAEILELAGTAAPTAKAHATSPRLAGRLRDVERLIVRYAVKYGVMFFCDGETPEGEKAPMTVLDFLASEMSADEISFSNPDYTETFRAAADLAASAYPGELAHARTDIEAESARLLTEEREKLIGEGDLSTLQANELALKERIDTLTASRIHDFELHYLERRLASSLSDTVRRVVNEVAPDKYVLSKVHTKYSEVPRDEDRLGDIVLRGLLEWRDTLLTIRLEQLHSELKLLGSSGGHRVHEIMEEIFAIMECRKNLAKHMGERVVAQR